MKRFSTKQQRLDYIAGRVKFYKEEFEATVKEKEGLTIVEYETDKPVLVIFKGSKTRPVVNYRFHTREQRDEYLEKEIANAKDLNEYKKKNTTFKHSLQVGDIFYSSWGYDQTNIDFFEVVRLSGKQSVDLRPIAAEVKYDSAVYGKKRPLKGKFKGDIIYKSRRVRKDNYVNIDDTRVASLGEDKFYAFSCGH